MALLGRMILLSLDGTPIAASKSCEITTSCDTIEKSSPTQGSWREFLAGRKEWNISCTWLLSSSYYTKVNLLKVGTTYTVKLGETSSSSSAYYVTGNAICTQAKIDASIGALAHGTFTFKGTGSLT